MTKMLALLDFTYPFDRLFQLEDDSDVAATNIARGSEFDADHAFEMECVTKGCAVRSDSADAQFVRETCRPKI